MKLFIVVVVAVAFVSAEYMDRCGGDGDCKEGYECRHGNCDFPTCQARRDYLEKASADNWYKQFMGDNLPECDGENGETYKAKQCTTTQCFCVDAKYYNLKDNIVPAEEGADLNC